jgi:autotransporter-associated beta strand protein
MSVLSVLLRGIGAAVCVAAVSGRAGAATLPDGYQPLKYIEGTGTQWINTGYTPKSTDTIEMELMFTKLGSNQAVWCARKSAGQQQFAFFWLTAGARFDYNGVETQTPTDTFNAAVNTRYTIKADSTTGELLVNDNVLQTYTPSSFTVGGQLTVFCNLKDGGGVDNLGHYRLYKFTVTSGGQPVVNFVPAERSSDGAIGVYDTVRQAFYANGGSGAFACEPVEQVVWTNAKNDGDIRNAENWTYITSAGETIPGRLPDATTPVVFAGNFAVQIPTNKPLVCKSVYFRDSATLTAHCDWRGLGTNPKFMGRLELAGFNLTVSGLSGDATIGSSAGNLLANPNFELDFVNRGSQVQIKPTGWTHSGDVRIFKDYSSYGNHVMDASTWVRCNYNSYIQQTFVIAEAGTYELSFNFGISYGGGNWVNSFWYGNMDGVSFSGGDARVGNYRKNTKTVTLTLAAGSHTLRIGCPRRYTNHAVIFDNLKLINKTLNKPSAGASVLTVDVPDGAVVTNTTALTGTVQLKVHKTGKGKLVMKTANQGFGARDLTSLVVDEGIVDKTSGDATCGVQYSMIEIQDGAQVQIGGIGYWDYNFRLVGSGPDGRGAIVNDTTVSSPWTKSTSYGYLYNLQLAGDATIGGSQSWAMSFYNHQANTMTMNGHTVTYAGTTIYGGNLSYSGVGKIVIARDGKLEFINANPSAADCDLIVHGELAQHGNSLSPVKSLLFAADGTFMNQWHADSKPCFVVREKYAPNINPQAGSPEQPTVQLGASGYDRTTLDLSLFTNAFNAASTTFFAGSTVTVETGTRPLADGQRLVVWEAVPEDVSFQLPQETAKRFTLAADETGLTLVALAADIPLTAEWIGGGTPGNLNDPANWVCYNKDNQPLPGVLPSSYTVVRVSGTTTLSVPADAERPSWKAIELFPERTCITQWGRIFYGSERYKNKDIPGEAWKTIALSEYAQMGEGNLANLIGKNSTWANANLDNAQLRFDGYFYVTPEQAGHWKIRTKFDDYFAFRIDNNWVAVNNTYTLERTFDTVVTEGWHRFTVVCGDTWGGQGGQMTGGYPMLVSPNGGGEVQFTTAFFRMGDLQPETLRLDADCDWTGLGTVALTSGAILDLNGHNLKVSALTAGDFVGAQVINSAETLSTLTIENPADSIAFDGVAVKGNIAVVKQGAGTMYATRGSDYTGGLTVRGGAVVCNAPGASHTLGYYDSKSATPSVVTVETNAVVDVNGFPDFNYYAFVLAGGEIKNAKTDLSDGTAQFSNVRLTDDSTWTATCSLGFIAPAYGAATLDLGGKTLTVALASSKYFYLYNSEVKNGLLHIISGGYLKVDKADCRAQTASFRICCALNLVKSIFVRDYIADYVADYNEGNGVIYVYGRFVPSETHNFFRGCVLQDGSTIDFGARTNAYSSTSSFSKGAKTLGYASGATVTVDLSKRTDDLRLVAQSDNPFVLLWTTEPAADVKFKIDAKTKSKGFAVRRTTIVTPADDTTPAVTRSGLALVYVGGMAVIIR